LLWEGRVPVEFSLAANEVTALEQQKLYVNCFLLLVILICLFVQLLLPRLSYLYFFAEQIRSHFLIHSADREGELWFEFSGTPLKWYAFFLF
jgi:hypothetical protein